ncbi:MAG: glutathione peroxidase [Campylobacterota bacterium]|nr:glutathione peroxidase [Campylobacterota bacterium]
MKKILLLLTFVLGILQGEAMIYNFKVQSIDGKEVHLSHYKNRVMLIVNVASQCGYTNQYEGLQTLHKKYGEKGLSVLGFPCNQFMNQEPQDEKAIKSFCMISFGVKFDMFSKIEVNGENAHPLYKYLKKEATGILGSEAIKWNFTKFLVDKQGKVIKRYGSSTKPKALEQDIQALLK